MRTRPRIRFRRVFAIVAVVYLLTMITLGGCADRLILLPTTQAIRLPGQSREVVESPTGPLEVWTTHATASWNREPQAFLLGFCGNGSRAEWEAQRLAE